MSVIFIEFWFKISFILCVIVFGGAILLGGIPMLLGAVESFYFIIGFSGFLAFIMTSVSMKAINEEVEARLHEKVNAEVNKHLQKIQKNNS